MTQFDFTFVDWSDDDSSPFDQCDYSSSSCGSDPLESSSTSSSSRTIKIRFAQEDDVVDHIHISDYTAEDIQATWFRPQEFREMRERAQRFVDLLEHRQGEPIENATMTSRGLEFRTTQGGMKRSLHKREAYAAVLQEQERQWIYGREDTERIAAAYQAVSAKCQGMAMLRGVQDAHDIQDYVKSSSVTSSTSSEPSTPAPSTESTSPVKPYEVETNIRRLAVLEDIKILSGASELDLLPINPAAA